MPNLRKILGSFLRAPAPILCGAFRDKGRVQTIYGWQANAGASGGVVVPEIITTLANAMIKWLSSSPKSLILVFVFWWIKQIKYLQQLYLMIVMELAMKTTLEFCLKLCKQASLLSSCHSYRSWHMHMHMLAICIKNSDRASRTWMTNESGNLTSVDGADDGDGDSVRSKEVSSWLQVIRGGQLYSPHSLARWFAHTAHS